jgi:prepilin-type processing-associated H-X9-DG protein
LPFQSTNKYKPYIQGTNPPFQYSLANTNQAGRYYKAVEWKQSSDRLLLGEGLAYFIQMSPVARVASTFNPKIHYWWPFDDTTQLDGSRNQWENNTYFWVEGSRHGPRDATKPMTYNRPYMNALFCDGHAAQVSVKQAWQAICDPGGKSAPTYP